MDQPVSSEAVEESKQKPDYEWIETSSEDEENKKSEILDNFDASQEVELAKLTAEKE